MVFKSGWSPERRAAHAEAIRRWKPWEKSTGPRTDAGKSRAARNAVTHGLHTAAGGDLKDALRRQRRFVRCVRRLIRLEKKAARCGQPVSRAALWAMLSDERNGETNYWAITASLQFGGPAIIKTRMWTVAALYRFVAIADLPALQAEVKAACLENDACGTLLLAPEGVNGTIAAPSAEKMANVIALLDARLGVKSGELKYSTAEEKPFRRMKVRLKKEIITMKAPEADPTKQVGTYVTPENWNALIADPDVTLIDTRNTYETAVGIFKGAIDPQIETFTQFKDYVANNMDPAKHKKVAMFCTGGIRCEKASSYMLAHGFEEVYHLQGGILKYLETVNPQDSKWEGDCFVFDRRVAIGHGLEESPYDICFGCRFPLSDADMQSASYEEGVSCPHCIDALTPEKARAFRMRHAQMERGDIPV